MPLGVDSYMFTNQSIIVWTLKTQSSQPFVLSLSKHEWRGDAPFDRLRVNGDNLTEQYWGQRDFLKNMSNQLWTP